MTPDEYESVRRWFEQMSEAMRERYHNDPIVHAALNNGYNSGLSYAESLELIVVYDSKKREKEAAEQIEAVKSGKFWGIVPKDL